MAVCIVCGGSGRHFYPKLIPQGAVCGACRGTGVRPDSAVDAADNSKDNLDMKKHKIIVLINKLDDDIDYYRDKWLNCLKQINLYSAEAANQLQQLKDNVESINPYEKAVSGTAADRNITASLMRMQLGLISAELSSLSMYLESRSNIKFR